MIPRPQPDEHSEYLAGYINAVPQGADLIAYLAAQPDEYAALLQNVSDEDAGVRPAPGEWSIKEVMGHLCDTERVFAYRALCIARGETAPLPGFDQDDYVAATNFNTRPLVDIVDEFKYQRRANVLCFRALNDLETQRLGTASGKLISVRAMLYAMAGHAIHHLISFKNDYHLG